MSEAPDGRNAVMPTQGGRSARSDASEREMSPLERSRGAVGRESAANRNASGCFGAGGVCCKTRSPGG
jgi:hypothetical protein